ncbi:hypothetical protein LMG7141_01864 [Ralstonia condita]|uniref:Uncharacterized protein n=1 Tax=Ralstonia condita TaxID=3058600 RepID=A0ABN9IR68_9RALS|nr:hypothetical protein LMG7141_01864 [Ralstonia sp. LMG 7141]
MRVELNRQRLGLKLSSLKPMDEADQLLIGNDVRAVPVSAGKNPYSPTPYSAGCNGSRTRFCVCLRRNRYAAHDNPLAETGSLVFSGRGGATQKWVRVLIAPIADAPDGGGPYAYLFLRHHAQKWVRKFACNLLAGTVSQKRVRVAPTAQQAFGRRCTATACAGGWRFRHHARPARGALALGLRALHPSHRMNSISIRDALRPGILPSVMLSRGAHAAEHPCAMPSQPAMALHDKRRQPA